MPKRTRITKQRAGTERLGPVLHRLRTERSISASELSEETGLSRSYLSYLERGRFADVGIDKFARLIQAMRVSADKVLAEAGYLPQMKENLPNPKTYLVNQYKLSGTNLQTAIKFLEFLARAEKRRPQTEREQAVRKKK
ncbi:MAG: helix-turn-helix domain-containing protein [Nitriliruptorales bacterium]